MLDERKSAILRAVVEEYIETAQPVGSARIAGATEVDVSAATVRNEMGALERDGYLTQPHTSAGRIPTDKGYRFFVDHLTSPGRLQPAQRQRVQEFFGTTHGALEQMLHDTSRLLSGLTSYASVVIGPPHEATTIRSAQLVGLSSRVALLVLVLSNGAVEKRSLEFDEDVGDERLAAATAHLSASLVGETLSGAGLPPRTGEAATDDVVARAVASLSAVQSDDPEHVFVGGTALMARAFDAVETVRQVLAILEQQYVVVTLLKDVLDRGLSVAIGKEVGLEPLAECAVVVAPYVVEGETAGTIGVVGPTRMKYPQALAAVAHVSQRLGRHFTEA